MEDAAINHLKQFLEKDEQIVWSGTSSPNRIVYIPNIINIIGGVIVILVAIGMCSVMFPIFSSVMHQDTLSIVATLVVFGGLMSVALWQVIRLSFPVIYNPKRMRTYVITNYCAYASVNRHGKLKWRHWKLAKILDVSIIHSNHSAHIVGNLTTASGRKRWENQLLFNHLEEEDAGRCYEALQSAYTALMPNGSCQWDKNGRNIYGKYIL